MKKKSKIVDTYMPNPQVLVMVTNAPMLDEEQNFIDYNRTVTLKIKIGRHKDPFKFEGEDGISKFVETIDFEDPQTNLFDEDTKPKKKGK
jgi:hypothetical protein